MAWIRNRKKPETPVVAPIEAGRAKAKLDRHGGSNDAELARIAHRCVVQANNQAIREEIERNIRNHILSVATGEGGCAEVSPGAPAVLADIDFTEVERRVVAQYMNSLLPPQPSRSVGDSNTIVVFNPLDCCMAAVRLPEWERFTTPPTQVVTVSGRQVVLSYDPATNQLTVQITYNDRTTTHVLQCPFA